MKKLYTILLAASVAISASAAEYAKAPVAGTGLNSIHPTFAKAMANQPTAAIKTTGHNARNVKAKAAATSISDLVGIYSMKAYSYRAQKEFQYYAAISAGEGENEIILEGIYSTNVTAKGTVDFTKGTITLKPQRVCPRNPEDGVSTDMILNLCDVVDGYLEVNPTADIVLTIAANGSILCEDPIAFSVEGMPGYSYGSYEDLVLTASDKFDTIVRYGALETDAENNFLVDGVAMPSIGFANATYEQELKLNSGSGIENLGEAVILEDFLYAEDFSDISPIYLDIDEGFDTFFIDNWYWGTYGGTYSMYFMYQADTLEGTFKDNTMSWNGTWGAFATKDGKAAGWFDLLKDCTITLPFNLSDETNAGISDITADNENAPVEYFNLQGMRVNEPAAGTIYIRRQGSSVSKILVK